MGDEQGGGMKGERRATRHTNAGARPEQRPCFLYGQHSAVGRSTAHIDCPFCGDSVLVYLWSLSGSGKRCACGALLTWGTAFR